MKLIKIPFSAGGLGKTKGCEKAPDMVVNEIKRFYLNEKGQKVDFKVETIPVNNANIGETNQNIYEHMLQNDEIPILIGGDHSITYSAFKAFAAQFKDTGLIVFDAHLDMMNDFSPPTHEDYLRALINEKIIDARKIVVVGVRNWHENEISFAKRNNIRYFTMKHIYELGMHEFCDLLMELSRDIKNLYLSIDIDGIDPAFAPGTGYNEPGGVSSREFLYILQRLNLIGNIRIIDLVEINPDKDMGNNTVILGAKIVKELLK